MSKKQSRRDFWRWWREQAEIERTIKVWPYAGELFWRAPHRMSGRAATRHEAMADAKAALRMKVESEGRPFNQKVWAGGSDGEWRPHRRIGIPGCPEAIVGPADAPSFLRALKAQGIEPDLIPGESLAATRAEMRLRTQGLGQAITSAAESMGRSALAMGRAVGAASLFAKAVEPGEGIEALQPPDFGLGATRSDIIQAEQSYGFNTYYRGRGE